MYFLMKKNKIIEIYGYGIFVDVNMLLVDFNDGGIELVMFDNVIIVIGSSIWLVFGILLLVNVVIYEE